MVGAELNLSNKALINYVQKILIAFTSLLKLLSRCFYMATQWLTCLSPIYVQYQNLSNTDHISFNDDKAILKIWTWKIPDVESVSFYYYSIIDCLLICRFLQVCTSMSESVTFPTTKKQSTTCLVVRIVLSSSSIVIQHSNTN